MYNPINTYRLQYNKQFRFKDASNLVTYFDKLGVGTIYASPIFEAVPGSVHGYDGINSHNINPEIGTREELELLCDKLKKIHIGWLQDIVPNHMAYDTGNPWLFDVLEKGRQSQYSGYFDIRWSTNEPIMVPFLGSELISAIRKGIIKLILKNGRLFFNVYEQNYPVNPASYKKILQSVPDIAHSVMYELIDKIPILTDNDNDYELWESFIVKLLDTASDPALRKHINLCLEKINNSEEMLSELLNEQAYHLCYWQLTHEKINYRRFFTVNELICLNIQDKKVFDDYHQMIIQLLSKGIFQGLRVDHIDGLYNPMEYLRRLREVAGKESYIIVEKILEQEEVLPMNWPVQGTTGYNFLAMVNNLFTYSQSEKDFTELYQSISRDKTPIAQQIKSKKEFILYQRMSGELENLFLDLKYALKSTNIDISHIDPQKIKAAIGAFLIELPVYRFYGGEMPLPSKEAKAIADIFDFIVQSQSELDEAVSLLKQLLFEKTGSGNHTFDGRMLHFYRRLMQMTGPLMAKGVEDTLMYSYNRFICHNEVGDSPKRFGISITDWHSAMKEKQERYPLAMNATSTHDTKRGEDFRARLNVLSCMPGEWLQAVSEYVRLNSELKNDGIPSLVEEYFIYQTLIGMFPMPGETSEDIEERLRKYIPKALREAKLQSNWVSPAEEYEQAVVDFTLALLQKGRPFRKIFDNLHIKVTDFGIINSLSQLILKCTCPGIPDIYQGTELWDLSLVDPDNRRPVDYDKRNRWLGEIAGLKKDNICKAGDVLWQERHNGKIKLWLTQILLSYRKTKQDMFLYGDYIPMETAGTYKNNVLAYARKYKNSWLIVVVPLYLPVICKSDENMIREFDWQDTSVLLPPNAPKEWNDLTDEKNKLESDRAIHPEIKSSLSVNKLFHILPLGIIDGEKIETARKAGILLHISSLPGGYGTGDMGPEAYSFARFLCHSGQKYWQVLPLNPTDEINGFSPYGSTSAMAGNTLLISPERLVEQGLLQADEIENQSVGNAGKACFKESRKLKDRLLSVTWNRYRENGYRNHTLSFHKFCESESYWLDDYAMYVILKDLHNGMPWHKWPIKYKKRYLPALEALSDNYAGSLGRVKWFQYLFSLQWKELRDYCRQLDIELFGDMPIYINHDSVDVWSNPQIFSIDEEGEPLAVAGVPPDYFSENGQLWGMPVFNWETMKQNGYAWWKKRIRRNLEMFDLIRLDHFRAFSAYWSIPAHHKTARDGEWKQGPGINFFNALEAEFGTLPFVAEDLGDIDEAVHILRRRAGLPGMKVLQFAFGDNMPTAENIPHNFAHNTFVYTGTHDNNTTAGWYKKVASAADRKRLSTYIGCRVRKDNVHRFLTRLAYASVSNTVIIPLQDVLGLGEEAVMNAPGLSKGNWIWRMKDSITDQNISLYLQGIAKTYGRL